MRYIANYFFKKVKISDFFLDKLKSSIVSENSVPIFVLRLRGWMELNFMRFILKKYFKKNIGYAENYYYFSSVSRKNLENSFNLSKPIVVFLKKGKGDRTELEIFSKLKELAEKHKKEITIFPTVILWRKLARRIKPTWKNVVYGDDRYPSRLQKLLFLFLACPDTVINVESGECLEKYITGKEKFLNKSIKARIFKKIVMLEKSIVGPLLRQRERLIRLVLKDKKLNEIIDTLVETSGGSKREHLQKAKKMLYEISADYRESMVNRFRKILNWGWTKVIEGFWVNEKAVEKYRIMSKNAPSLIMPCHRSHADYLIVSFLFYKYNLMIPYIAAGINLSFFPMGPIFRRSGAYFIRRTFRGEKLYPYVLESYIKRLLIDGTAQEFFPEGTRSRTGKMLHPKTGLLSFNLNALKEGAVNDILIAPVSVVYGRLFESGAYKKESEGQAKVKEDAKGVVKVLKLLGKKFGKVYVNMADPYFISSYFNEKNIDIQNMDDKEFRQLINDLGYKFIREIQNATVITPISLVSLILLSDIKKGIKVDSFNIRVGYALKYLEDYSKFADSDIETFKNDLNKAIDFLLDNEKIKAKKIDGQVIYQVSEEMRNDLEYYKNNIVHYFLNASFLSLALVSMKKNTISKEELFSEYKFLKDLFFNEFVYESHDVKIEEMEISLNKLNLVNLIEIKGEKISFDSNGHVILKNIAGIVMSYVEAYYTVVESYYTISRDHDKLPPTIFPLFLSRGKLLFEMGDIKRKESINKFYYQNAHQWMNKNNYLNWNNLYGVLGKKIENEDTIKYFKLKDKLKNYSDSVFK